jgi:3-hydroxybutyryl-CoA dehydrogenase
LGNADLVIETVRENLSDKLAVLDHVQRFCGPDAIVTTNTSSLNLSDLESAIRPPGRFAGLHWFHPADLIELVEVVPAPSTEDSTLETLGRWMSGIDKTPVILNKAVPGFVANRLQYALLREAYRLVAAGVCSFSDVDNAVTAGLGPRWAALGPFQCMDFAGLDVHLAVAEILFPDLACDRVAPEELKDLVRGGGLGVKSGFGLSGHYSPARALALATLRDEMLHLVADLRRSWEEGTGDSIDEGSE